MDEEKANLHSEINRLHQRVDNLEKLLHQRVDNLETWRAHHERHGLSIIHSQLQSIRDEIDGRNEATAIYEYLTLHRTELDSLRRDIDGLKEKPALVRKMQALRAIWKTL